MKFVKVLFKCFVFFILGVFVCILSGMMALSYYSVDQLSKALAPEAKQILKNSTGSINKIMISQKTERSEKEFSANPNLKDITQISIKYINELNLFDELAKELANKPTSNICSTLCNHTAMDLERLRDERSTYLMTYYKQQGVKTLDDPLFRLRLKETGLISTLFPPSLRSVLSKIQSRVQSGQLNTADKLNFAIMLQSTIIWEIASLYFQRNEFIQNAQELKLLRKLHQSCSNGSVRKENLSNCNTSLISRHFR